MIEKLKYLAVRTGGRAIKTFCQTEAAILTAAGVGILDADWKASLSASGMAALLSVLTTLGGDAITKPGDDTED
jgi:hypothetical protein